MVEAASATLGHIDTAASTVASRNVFPDTRMLGSLVWVSLTVVTVERVLPEL
jgi:hypothetical protein